MIIVNTVLSIHINKGIYYIDDTNLCVFSHGYLDGNLAGANKR